MERKQNKKFLLLSIVLILIITGILGKTVNASGKVIIIGDSRTRNMSRWVKTSAMETRFIAKSGQGYEWFINEAAKEATGLAEKGDTILIWLGVNDYDASVLFDKYGKTPWELYVEAINKLAETDWADCKVCVAAAGYVDRGRMISFYGFDIKSNVTVINNSLPINGINGFNNYLKEHLDSSIIWFNPNEILGISDNDSTTRGHLWVKRSNGMYDGLHYSKVTSQKIYDYFVREVRTLSIGFFD